MQLTIATMLKNKTYSEFSYDSYLDTLKVRSDLNFLDKPVYQVAFPDWDNAPRYNERATFFYNVKLEKFVEALEIIKSQLNEYDEKIVFINAWNEWSEGAYLEPDTVNGHKYLEAVNDVFRCES